MCFIDPGSVTKSAHSALTKQKILDVYADVFKGLRTFPGEPYKFKLEENYVPARHASGKFLSIYNMTFIKKYMILSNKEC